MIVHGSAKRQLGDVRGGQRRGKASGAEEQQPPATMSADRIEITSEVFWACSMHAMSTEVEEIMGLLLGEGQHSAGSWYT